MNQSTSSIDTNKGVTERKAPVGHRQPALKELPAEVLQREQAPSSIRANLVFGSDTPQNGAIIGLTIVAVFLAGIGIGDILSKSKQANTNYAAVISRIAGASP